MLHRMHLVEESKSGSRVAEGGSRGKGVGVVAGRARHQVAGEEDVRGWMRKMMVIVRKKCYGPQASTASRNRCWWL